MCEISSFNLLIKSKQMTQAAKVEKDTYLGT